VAALIVMNEDDRSKQREVLTSAVKKALLSAAKEALGPLRQLRVEINQKTGAIHAFAKLVVAENVSDKRKEISLPDARQIKQQVEIGEELEVDVTPVGFGRVAARFAKQALMDQLRRAEGGL
jgi:N utilization substance protein A